MTNRIAISLPALEHNFRLVRQQTGAAVRIMAVVKADAYGHGLLEAAQVFARAGADAFGVGTAAEGEILRQEGFQQEIVILVGLLPEAVESVVKHDLSPVVIEPLLLEPLAQAAARSGKIIGVHLKLDAGMGRAGALPAESKIILEQIQKSPSLRLKAVMAHLPSSDQRKSTGTHEIRKKFHKLLAGLASRLPPRLNLHIANSGGVFFHPESHLDMVRPGISLYGGGPVHSKELGQRLAMRFSSRVIQLRHLPANTGLGYDHTWITRKPTDIALLPVGYGDNYSRRLSNRGQVLIHGQRAAVVGRVSMNLTMVDVTAIKGVRPGDEAVLLGKQNGSEITVQEVAEWMETISYEVFCLFGGKTKRVYTRS